MIFFVILIVMMRMRGTQTIFEIIPDSKKSQLKTEFKNISWDLKMRKASDEITAVLF